MLYYLYLKKQIAPGKTDYFTLTSINHDESIQPGMTFIFDPISIHNIEREHPELRGMQRAYRVVNVYECDGMGGVTLE